MLKKIIYIYHDQEKFIFKKQKSFGSENILIKYII